MQPRVKRALLILTNNKDTMTTETVFLELPDVRVTNTKVTISGTTYFLPNITSVKLREDRGMRTTGIIIGVFALLLLLLALFMIWQHLTSP